MTPSKPKAAALRSKVPTLPGSCTRSSARYRPPGRTSSRVCTGCGTPRTPPDGCPRLPACPPHDPLPDSARPAKRQAPGTFPAHFRYKTGSPALRPGQVPGTACAPRPENAPRAAECCTGSKAAGVFYLCVFPAGDLFVHESLPNRCVAFALDTIEKGQRLPQISAAGRCPVALFPWPQKMPGYKTDARVYARASRCKVFIRRSSRSRPERQSSWDR